VNGGAFGDFAGDEGAGEAGFELALEEAFQRARAKDGVVAFFGGPFVRLLVELNAYAAVGESRV